MSTEGSGETPSTVPSLPGAPEQTYLFPKSKGHSRSVSHGGMPMVGGATSARAPLRSALRGHQRALSHGQIGEGAPPGSGHSRAPSRTDFILPAGHREAANSGPGAGTLLARANHSRQASRSDSIYTLRAVESTRWRSFFLRLLRRKLPAIDNRNLMVTPNHIVPEKTPLKEHPNASRCSNKIRTTKYTILSFIPKNLFEQFHRIANVYFIFIVLLNWVPAINAFGKEIAMLPVLFVLTVTAIKDLFEDRRRNVSDRRINNSNCRVYKRSAGRYVQVKWKDVTVGDIIHLSNNEAVPADMVLLHSSSPLGSCYLDTCNLDGETNLKQRLVVPQFRGWAFDPSKFNSTVEVERPSTKIYRFNGLIITPKGDKIPLTSDNLLLRECTVKNTDFVEGIVVYAGHETKAMLNNGGPRYKCSKLERKMNTDVVWCILVLLFLCCAGAVGCKLWLDQFPNVYNVLFIKLEGTPAFESLLIFWTFIIVLQVMIPVSLYVTLELAKLMQVYHIHQDVEMYDASTNSRVECRALNITEELGQIQYLFSDKTGTLTENKMEFKRCVVLGEDYEHVLGDAPAVQPALPCLVTPTSFIAPNKRMLQKLESTDDEAETATIREFLLILAVCNTVVVSLPHVDHLRLDDTSDVPNAKLLTLSNGSVRSNDKYARLTESRSTTPSPPPTNSSPLRIMMHKLKDDSTRAAEKAHQTTPRFEAESPDELALADAAIAYGYELRARQVDEVTVGVRGELVKMKVLRVQAFDAARKCMSVAVKLPTGMVALYVKGADCNVLSALAPVRAGTREAHVLERTRELLSEYSRSGLRTLVMAKRVMNMAQWEEWLAGHHRAMEPTESRERKIRESLNRLESALTLVGATGVEDRLQAGVPRTVRALLDAGVVVWVLTGDKPETAVNIAYSAALFSPADRLLFLMSKNKDHAEQTIKSYLESDAGAATEGRALVVDGKTLTYILDRRSGLVAPFLSLAKRCSSVLCCRATPLQKAYIVKAVKEELDVTTLAVGDGANDVSMIQTADVGVGISGQEGRQAVMASDYSVSKFRLLERLLLVHGHWSYDRLSRMILYFFLKNASFVFLIFWYQAYCGFSAMVMIDQIHMMTYNLMFTAFPPLIIGVYDRVAPSTLLLDRPGLYYASRRGLSYRPHSYWMVLSEALYISAVVFFAGSSTYWDTNKDIWEYGTYNMTAILVIMTAYVAIETRSWTVIHVLALAGSLGAYFVFTLVYQSICMSILSLPSTYHVLVVAASHVEFWLLIALTTVVCLAPRVMYHAVRNTLHPTALRRAVLTRRRPRRAPHTAAPVLYHAPSASAHVYRATDEATLDKRPAHVATIT